MAGVKKKSPSSEGLKQLKKQLAEGDIQSLYVFYGEEDYLREYYLDQMRKTLLTGGLDEFNYHLLEGERLELQTLSDAVNALPMMSQRSMVVVRDYDPFKADAGKREQLAELLGDLPEYVCLVFVFDVLEYKPGQEQKVRSVFQKKGVLVEFSKQSHSDLMNWVRRRFAALGKEITPTACEHLLFLCDGTMNSLIPEIEKTAAYCTAPQVTERELNAVVTPVLDAVLFDMTDAIGEKNFAKAISLLRDLFALKYDPTPVLGAIGRQLRQLYSAKLLGQQRGGEQRLMELWKMRSAYPAKLLIRTARGFSLDWFRKAVSLCEQTDCRLKSMGGDRNQMLELMVLELSMMART